MDTYTLKLSGSVDVIQPLERNEEYSIHIRGEVTSITESGDDNRNYAYKITPLLADVVGKHGEKLGGKDKSKFAQQCRQRAYSCNQDYQDELDFDQYVWEAVKRVILDQMSALIADARDDVNSFISKHNDITG